MKKIEKRTVLCLILAAALVAGLGVFCFKFVFQGGNWVSFAANRHLYNSSGQLTVGRVLDRNGDVLSASVDKSRSASDNCMTEAALEVAMRSRFNVDPSAPGRHSGTVTYVFVPQ